MVLDVIGGAVLLAFGIVVIKFAVDGEKSDEKFLVALLIGAAAVIGGAWILITKITLATLLIKVAGLVLFLIGFFLTVKFPDTNEYQRESMSAAGVLIGLVMLILGFYLLFFG